jgi:hypothetical protein
MTCLRTQAGGWLGRVYLLDWGVQGVDRFVSLGSPHQPPPQVDTSVCCGGLSSTKLYLGPAHLTPG